MAFGAKVNTYFGSQAIHGIVLRDRPRRSWGSPRLSRPTGDQNN
jgi:hypothetical protein